ncbi:beta-galactosidase [Paenibacillus sediminis]|uniref:Beta-galactosidase n=1 Tax=Paenibacillus sediminis TaxID=664909 RepID=A0ABS4GZQ7_9BACL|nr:beta-galactosidase [Paenibacillus sediminis]MBP1935512.1 beta-galactosidase [Paenibacillus sediminis]
MIEIVNKQIRIDGKPQLIMCGEIHYFRLQREEWQDRLDKLKAAGCNAVASYVPWLCHEPTEGHIDLEGLTRPELDLAGFIDLCHENGLYFFLRPGPFIMAEMKNEGLPYWVYEKHPEIIPTGWDGRLATTRTIDYLAPGFLKEARRWYEAVMAVAVPRLQPNGGNIIAIQLDNEIGMLSWVSNGPDLTDFVVEDFAAWLGRTYSLEELAKRYPFDLNDAEVRKANICSPREDYAPALHLDLGHYMRNRFARYVDELRGYAEEFGVRDIPFVINIHGTGGGRGFTFPIGISQLYETYEGKPGYISGSDIYFGDLDMNTFQDLYLINGFMDAVHDEHQPLTSVEFNCGDGNFGETYGARYDPSAADFKMRMCIAQGNRLINYYLFAGGRNYVLDEKPGDGNDRVAFTGERHGFAAPVSPEGELNYTFDRMAQGIHAVMAVADKVAVMQEERDAVSFAFIPDYYMTEYRYPGSDKMKKIYENIEANRAYWNWETMARAMLLAGYRFGAADIQNKPLRPDQVPVLALLSARYMDGSLQHKLADYLEQGGKVFLYGEVPLYDMEGKPCTVLADALSLRYIEDCREAPNYYPSVLAEGWAAPRPEVRTHFAQTFEHGDLAEAILRLYGTGQACGFDIKVGRGRAIVIAARYKCDIDLYRTALELLGAKPGLTHDSPYHGIFMTSTRNEEGERFIHVLNLDGFDKTFHIYDDGMPLFDGRSLTLGSKEGVMLPVNVTIRDVTILSSTAEVAGSSANEISFRLTQAQDWVLLRTNRPILPSDDYTVEEHEGALRIVSLRHAKIDDRLTIRFGD